MKVHLSPRYSVGATEYLGDRWTFIDCPGSIEFAQEAYNALNVVDTAVVVCEPDVTKALTLAPILRYLDERQIPHMLFINKMDIAANRVAEILDALQRVSERPLVLRQVPIRDGDTITGYASVKEVYEKTGRSGRMVFVVSRTRYANARGEDVSAHESSLVHRQVQPRTE